MIELIVWIVGVVIGLIICGARREAGKDKDPMEQIIAVGTALMWPIMLPVVAVMASCVGVYNVGRLLYLLTVKESAK